MRYNGLFAKCMKVYDSSHRIGSNRKKTREMVPAITMQNRIPIANRFFATTFFVAVQRISVKDISSFMDLLKRATIRDRNNLWQRIPVNALPKHKY
jgi:hypothetical protein